MSDIWNCPRCTLENKITNTICDACEGPCPVLPKNETTDSDFALAWALAENENEKRRLAAKKHGTSNVRLYSPSFAPTSTVPAINPDEMPPLPSNSHETRKILEAQAARDRGEPVTRHDQHVTEQHNAYRVERFEGCGNMEGIDLPVRPYNELKDHFHAEIRKERRSSGRRISNQNEGSRSPSGDEKLESPLDTPEVVPHPADAVDITDMIDMSESMVAPTPTIPDGDWEVLESEKPEPTKEETEVSQKLSPKRHEKPSKPHTPSLPTMAVSTLPPPPPLKSLTKEQLQSIVEELRAENAVLKKQVTQLQEFSKSQIQRVCQLESTLNEHSSGKK